MQTTGKVRIRRKIKPRIKRSPDSLKKAVKMNRQKGAEKRMAELSPKRRRQYAHILKSELKEGRSEKIAKRIAMATTNKTRREKGELL